MSLNIAVGLRESAVRFPEKTALIFGEQQISYHNLHRSVQHFAGGLRELGVKRGQHVALMLPNVPHFPIAYYGALYNGNAIVPLNVLLKADEIAYHLADSDAVALVVWEGFYEFARAGFEKVESCKHLIVARADNNDVSSPEGSHSFGALLQSTAPVLELPDTMPDDTAVILYTSGTTGKPKGAELSQFNLFYNALYTGRDLMPLSSEDVSLATLPLFHSFGQTVIQNASLMRGMSVVFLAQFEPEKAFQLMEKHKVTLFAGVPTMYFALLNHPNAGKYDLSHLKYCCSGGASMPVEVMKAFDQKYNVQILEGYGLSETSPVASFNVLDRPRKPGSVGVPIQGVEFRLTDEQGQTIVESDVPGEIWIKGHNVMKGYYKNPDATESSISDGGWFHTGDIAKRDSDGFYYIVDRKKDMVIRGGFNVYPREIEEILYSHPLVIEAAVIGVPDLKYGEEVKAVVALKQGETLEEQSLIDFCKERLAAYKYPRIVEIRDALPKGPTGKILKRALRS